MNPFQTEKFGGFAYSDETVRFAEKRIKELTALIYLFRFGYVQIISVFVFRADNIVSVNRRVAGA